MSAGAPIGDTWISEDCPDCLDALDFRDWFGNVIAHRDSFACPKHTEGAGQP